MKRDISAALTLAGGPEHRLRVVVEAVVLQAASRKGCARVYLGLSLSSRVAGARGRGVARGERERRELGRAGCLAGGGQWRGM